MGILGAVTIAAALVVTPPAGQPGRRASPEPPRGVGLLTVGSTTLGLGVLLTTFGGIFVGDQVRRRRESADPLSNHGYNYELAYGMLIPGILILAGGAAMTAAGGVRWHRHKQWLQTGLTPAIGSTRQGTWTFGVQLRF